MSFRNTRLKWLLREPLTYGANEAAVATNPEWPRYIRITDLNDNGTLRHDSFKTLEPEIAAAYMLSEGDMLFARSGATSGKAFLFKDEYGPACFAGYLIRAKLNRDLVLPSFVYYFTQSQLYWQQISESTIQATIQNVSAEKYSNLELPLPPLETQRRIGSYLDRETSEIDRLIAAKERILTLLAEKRRAIITHAVNNGLDDEAEKSRTELPWFGFSPRHWEIRKFTHIVKITEGQVSPDDDEYSSLPLIAPNHIESGTGRLINLETAEEQAAISGKYLCKAGDVIYSKIRPALQKVVIAPQECLCSADMYPMATTTELLPRFLFWLLLGDSFSTWAILESGRVAMPKVNRESLGELRIPVPPIREQRQICDYIESQVKRLDLLRQACLRSVSILNERRSALIAAAVTGQISIEEEDK